MFGDSTYSVPYLTNSLFIFDRIFNNLNLTNLL